MEETAGMIDGEMFCAFIDILGFKSRVLTQDNPDDFRATASTSTPDLCAGSGGSRRFEHTHRGVASGS